MNDRKGPLYSLIKTVFMGCVLWSAMSLVIVPCVAIVCLPFLIFHLYLKAFFIGISVLEVAFTLCLIHAIIYSVTYEQKGENDESE